ncbi:unnamed protein product [Arctogadus glacialis]
MRRITLVTVGLSESWVSSTITPQSCEGLLPGLIEVQASVLRCYRDTRVLLMTRDPVLFTGTVRTNLDPFSRHTDEDLWNALQEVQMKGVVEELPCKLETMLAESGSNFSVGQKQLVCLARAVLRKNRILVIDEATANVDPRTDSLIQETIREKFDDCTVLTIAHRLNTIIHCDRILVLEAGRIREFDEPHVLLQDRHGVLYQMVEQTGPAEAASLHHAASQVYMNKSRPCLSERLRDGEEQAARGTRDPQGSRERHWRAACSSCCGILGLRAAQPPDSPGPGLPSGGARQPGSPARGPQWELARAAIYGAVSMYPRVLRPQITGPRRKKGDNKVCTISIIQS